MIKRECKECTKCCEGWLHATINGHAMYKGRKCFYLESKCTIYPNRPKDPCCNFQCSWLIDNEIPAWLKPSLSNVIIHKRKHENIEYYFVIETGVKMDSTVLNWLITFALSNNKNIMYEIDGGINKMGSKEFLALNI